MTELDVYERYEVRRALSMTKVNQRDLEIIWMRANGYTLAAIGEQFNISPSRVGQVIGRSRRRLEKHLSGKGWKANLAL